MYERKHMAEPWRTTGHEVYSPEATVSIAAFYNLNGKADHNSVRAVACVNACEGIEFPVSALKASCEWLDAALANLKETSRLMPDDDGRLLDEVEKYVRNARTLLGGA